MARSHLTALLAVLAMMLTVAAPAHATMLAGEHVGQRLIDEYNPNAYPEDAAGRYLEPHASALATRIAGRPIEVVCVAPGPSGNATVASWSVDGGATWTWNSAFTLSQSFCAAFAKLVDWRDNREYVNDDADRLTIGIALLDITHEVMHITLQSHDEGVVECAAYRNLWPTVAALGLPRRIARAVYASAQTAHTMNSVVYDDGTLNEYRSIC